MNIEIKNLSNKQNYIVDIDCSRKENKLTCPYCSSDRKKHRTRCLSYNTQKQVGYCHHCGSKYVAKITPFLTQITPFSDSKTPFSTSKNAVFCQRLTPIKSEACKINMCNSIDNPIIKKYLKDPRLNARPDDNLTKYLKNTFLDYIGLDELEEILNEYNLIRGIDGQTIYPYIDINGNYRSAKILPYNSATGRRIKTSKELNALYGTTYPFASWLHSNLIKMNLLDKEFKYKKCLFGEHLLNKYPNANIVLVESEKTAIISSLYQKYLTPQYLTSTKDSSTKNVIYLATGGKNNISYELLYPLKDRNVVIIPDNDAFEYWEERKKSIGYLKDAYIMNILLIVDNDMVVEKGYDYGDYIIDKLTN